MKHYQILFLKIVTIIAVVPILFLCLYQFPLSFIEGFNSDSVYVKYIFVILISVYLMAIPYILSLYHGYKLLVNIDSEKTYSDSTIKSLFFIQVSAFIIALLFLIDLPVVYIIANLDDAPGLILIGMGFVGVSLTIGVFAGLLKTIVNKTILERALLIELTK
ncbi:MAG: DUF2975 domain-containing protein [Candidatus Izimaplasma sp.]|nr:DUF2975 domain-containing protein [Candidatus Izimaplasma bacterium]